MGKHIFIHHDRDVPSAEHYYVGSISCPRALLADFWYLQVEGPLTLVVPPLTKRWLARYNALLAELTDRRDLALTFNDFGAFRRTRQGGIKADFNVGPLLAGQDTAPEIENFVRGTKANTKRQVYHDGGVAELYYAPPPKELLYHWQTPSALDQWPLYEGLGFTGLELTNQPAGWGDVSKPTTIYTGFVPLTYLPCGDCEACPQTVVEFYRDAEVVLYRYRNMVFYLDEGLDIPPAAKIVDGYLSNDFVS